MVQLASLPLSSRLLLKPRIYHCQIRLEVGSYTNDASHANYMPCSYIVLCKLDSSGRVVVFLPAESSGAVKASDADRRFPLCNSLSWQLSDLVCWNVSQCGCNTTPIWRDGHHVQPCLILVGTSLHWWDCQSESPSLWLVSPTPFPKPR